MAGNHLQRFRSALDVLATCAMIMASSVLVWAIVRGGPTPTEAPKAPQERPSRPLPTEPVSLGANTLGSASAPLGLIEFSDFECPFCIRFHSDTYPSFVKDYVESGKVLFAFRHLPLETRHPNAVPAAQAADCAGQQQRFWAMHDALFRPPLLIDRSSIDTKAKTLSLDMPRFESCLDGTRSGGMGDDTNLARKLQITGTPTFLIGTMLPSGSLKVMRRESGAIPFQNLRKMLDDMRELVARK